MDSDASPLVQADQLAAQGEQLASRRAYQQAVTAHTASARQYQAAAQAIADLGAAKALLLQRDRQLKLAADCQRKLTSTAGPATTRGAPSARRDDQILGSGRGPVNVVAGRAGATGLASRGATPGPSARGQPGGPASPSSPGAAHASTSTSTAAAYNGSYRQTASYAPPSRSVVDRIDASVATMADSRYSRHLGAAHAGFGNGSPTASTISSSTYAPSRGTNSGDESGKASGVEESYYLMRNDHDPDDPMSAFLARIDNMVEELGNNAVAFASAPLFMPSGSDQSKGGDIHSDGTALPSASDKQPSPAKSPRSSVQDSFYVVPQATPAAGSGARTRQSSSSSSVSKTHEELLAENATLKENLDQLTKQLHWLSKERQREREAMKGSVTLFARDVKKQAEKVMMHQSTASLLPMHGAASKRQMPPLPSVLPHTPDDAAQRRIAQLEQDLRTARDDLHKQTGIANKYKSKYDEVRKQIMEKRRLKEEAAAAAAAADTSGVQDTVGSASVT